MGDTPLLESNAFSTCERMAMKKIISREKTKRNFTYLELCTRQFCPVHIHLSQGLTPLILTVVIMHVRTNIFLFLLFFLILYFFSFDFLFLFIDNEEACDCDHMTYHMM